MGWVGLDEEKWTHVHLWVSLRAESEARAVAGEKKGEGLRVGTGKIIGMCLKVPEANGIFVMK